MKPIQVNTLGDYYKTPNLKDVCTAIKNGEKIKNYEYLIRALCELIPPYSTIVPVPSNSNGIEWLAIDLAREIGTSVSFCLYKERNYSLYELKKKRNVTEFDVKIGVHNTTPIGAITLFDNVLATGTTINKCMSLLGRPCFVVCIAADLKTYTNYNTEL